jgi:pyroglutamyl-peptidase
MSATFLVTGFEPFGEHRTNSSWDALERQRPSWPESVVTLRLPVDHRAAHFALRRALDELQPIAVLCTGLAKGSSFRVERQARHPIELGGEIDAQPIAGRWPWREMLGALEERRVPAIESFDAGRYVCESTYWSLLTHDPSGARPAFAGFLHVPSPSNDHSIEDIAAAVAAVVDARRQALLIEPARALFSAAAS